MSSVFIFEIVMILVTIGLLYFMKKNKYKHIFLKSIILFVGVFLFEVMSEPMWRNFLLNPWAYIYNDVSWIITLGWVNIFLVSIILVDYFFKKLDEKRKFWLYLLFVTIITVPVEAILLNVGIRAYDPVLLNTMTGITFLSAPIETLFIVPMIAAFVIPFYKVVYGLFEK